MDYLAANLVCALTLLGIAALMYFTPIGTWLADLAKVFRS